MVNSLKKLVSVIEDDILLGANSRKYEINDILGYDDVMVFGKEVEKLSKSVDKKVMFFAEPHKSFYPLKPKSDVLIFCRMTTSGSDAIHVCVYEEDIIYGEQETSSEGCPA